MEADDFFTNPDPMMDLVVLIVFLGVVFGLIRVLFNV